MKVFVDTSVWVDFFRAKSARAVEGLRALLADDRVALAAPVRIELLSGVRKQDATRIGRLLGAVPTFRPSAATWETMEDWALRGAAAGYRFGVGDLMIGAIAAEHGRAVWSFDADFTRMAELGFVTLHQEG